MDRIGEQHVKQNRSECKIQVSCVSSLLWNLGEKDSMKKMGGTLRNEQKEGEGEGKLEQWEVNVINVYLLCIKMLQ